MIVKSYLKMKLTVKVKSIDELNNLKETLAEAFVMSVGDKSIEVDAEYFYVDLVIKPWVSGDIAGILERHIVRAPGKVYPAFDEMRDESLIQD